MDTTQSRFIFCSATFAVTLVSGIILSNAGKPYSSGIFSIHKLIAIASIILIAITIYNWQKTIDLSALYPLLWVATGLCFAALIVSGSVLSLVDANLLSLNAALKQIFLTLHQIVPVMALAGSALSLYLLVSQKA